MTPERLSEIKARCEAATGGPWRIGVRLDSAGWPLFSIRDLESIGEKEYDANALFIQNARQDLPDCIKEIERMRGIMTILENIKTKHGLLEGLSVYGPCKCKPGQLCMRHAALDIIGMINDHTELEQK